MIVFRSKLGLEMDSALLSYHSVGLATKVSVNFGLFGGTLVSLGSKKHVDAYEDKVRNLQVRGGKTIRETSSLYVSHSPLNVGFGLTELGHGRFVS